VVEGIHREVCPGGGQHDLTSEVPLTRRSLCPTRPLSSIRPIVVADRGPGGRLRAVVTGPTTEMIELERAECLRLLAATEIGRIAISVAEWNHPLVRPVNYVFDEPSQSVLIRSASGSKLNALLRSARAVFEIDGIDWAGRIGWSVIVVGVAEEITSTAEVRRIANLGLEPWAPGHKGHWIRIRTNVVSGRRIELVTDDVSSQRA
jgi:nitroimidazol reductase NimA-like FMN-containing flavoprotein (pyridoxamine 5'-phosphate oxidase superfamily)